MRLVRWLAPLLFVVLSACGSAPASAPAPAVPAAGPAPAALQSVTLRLNFLPSPYHAAYYLAKARGYYKAAGLDVGLAPGKGSAVTGQTVGNGSDTFGIIDATTAARLISQGVPIKMVAVFEQQTDQAFIYRPPINIQTLADLKGHPIITGAADAPRLVMDGLLATNHMSESDLKVNLVDAASEHGTFLSTPGSIYLGSVDNDLPILQGSDSSVTATPYTKFGTTMYTYGIVVKDSMLQEHPDWVRGLLAASSKGWQDTLQDPVAAAQAMAAAVPDLKEAAIEAGVKQMVQLVHTPATKGHPLGWQADSDWQSMLTFLHDYMKVDKTLSPSSYYTNEFLPRS